jgi:hypothetical protein
MMEQGSKQENRPDMVSKAITLLYVTLGIGLLRTILEAPRLSKSSSLAFVLFVGIFVLGFTWLIVYKIAKGRNWARITFLILFVLGIPLSVVPLLQSLAVNLFSGLLGICQVIIQVISLVLLFLKPSSEWFKRMKENAGPIVKSDG